MCERYIDQLSLTHPQLGTWPPSQACALTGNRTDNPLVRRPAPSPLIHTSQGKFTYYFLNDLIIRLKYNWILYNSGSTKKVDFTTKSKKKL